MDKAEPAGHNELDMDSMTDFETLFLRRKSVRAWEDRPIPQVIKERILAATLRAPTAGNLMLYSIIEIEDQPLKEKLAETCDHQSFIAKAPWVLVFLADYRRLMDYYEAHGAEAWCARHGKPFATPREADLLLLACCDALIAAQTAALAAEYLHLGSCYIGDVMEQWETHRELLSLPRYTFPITMLCIGCPTPVQKARPQPPRLPASMIVMKNRYQRLSEEALQKMYQGPGWGRFEPDDDVENPGQALYRRKFAAEFSIEMRRSVRSMLKDWD